MEDLIKQTSKFYLTYRETLQRLLILAVIDLLFRLISSNVINESTSWNVYFLIGALLLLLLLPDTYLDHVAKAFSCYLLMAILLPSNSPQNSLIAKLRWTYSSVRKNDELFIHMYTQCVVLLMTIASLCSMIHLSFSLVKKSLTQFLGFTIILCIFQFVSYRVPLTLLTKNIPLRETLKVFLYISTFYVLSKLWQLRRQTAMLLVIIHFKTMYYDGLSPFYIGSAFVTWEYVTRKEQYYFHCQTIWNHIRTKLSSVESIVNDFAVNVTPYSIIIAILISFELNGKLLSDFFGFVQSLVIIMCSTSIGTLAYITFVSLICICFLHLVMFFLQGRHYAPILKEDITAVIMLLIIFTMQTISQSAAIHGRVMYYKTVVIGVCLLNAIHSKCEPILLETGASFGTKLKCLKILFIFILLVLIPPFAVYKFLSYLPPEINMLWPIAIATSWILTSVEAVGSVLAFFILKYDQLRRAPLEQLEDYIYYINLATAIFQIFVGIFGMAVLLWDMVTVKWDWINLFILGLNFFFIYNKITDKFKEYKKRRDAAQRLSYLADATRTQIEEHSDDCSICLRPMTSAKVTKCKHLFHVTCLKKWSYIKTTCPMCNRVIDDNLANERYRDQLMQILHELQLQRNNVQLQ